MTWRTPETALSRNRSQVTDPVISRRFLERASVLFIPKFILRLYVCLLGTAWTWAGGYVVLLTTGLFLLLCSGRCTNMVGAASALNITLPFFVLENCSPSKYARRVAYEVIFYTHSRYYHIIVTVLIHKWNIHMCSVNITYRTQFTVVVISSDGQVASADLG